MLFTKHAGRVATVAAIADDRHHYRAGRARATRTRSLPRAAGTHAAEKCLSRTASSRMVFSASF